MVTRGASITNYPPMDASDTVQRRGSLRCFLILDQRQETTELFAFLRANCKNLRESDNGVIERFLERWLDRSRHFSSSPSRGFTCQNFLELVFNVIEL